MKKKKIETIFSSLNDFSKIPPSELWEAIEEKLDEPKRKKRILLWWSIASSILIGLGVSSVYYFSINSRENFSKDSFLKENKLVIQKSNTTKNQVLNETDKTFNKTKHQQENSLSASLLTTSTAVRTTINSNVVLRSATNVVLQSTNSNISNQLLLQPEKRNNSALVYDQTNANSVIHTTKVTTNDLLKEKPSIKASATDSSENALTLLENQQENNKQKEKTLTERWSVQLHTGIATSQNYNNQKSLGITLSSQQTASYGVKTNYKLSRKWALSSGLVINEIGQDIAGVSYVNKSNSLALIPDNIIDKNRGVVAISNNSDYLFLANKQANTFSSAIFQSGDLRQKLKYIEMPVEVSYAILNIKKTNISLNTGGFVGKLISNKIFLNGNSIGENSGVNNLVFGTLLSSTLRYQVFKQTRFFVEPGMNYFVNPTENQPFNQLQLIFNFGLNVSF